VKFSDTVKIRTKAAAFYGDLSEVFEKICGKELSYNNLVDIDAAITINGRV
jgi:AICAR transformylase/IMP cyclohydrolase PurH